MYRYLVEIAYKEVAQNLILLKDLLRCNVLPVEAVACPLVLPIHLLCSETYHYFLRPFALFLVMMHLDPLHLAHDVAVEICVYLAEVAERVVHN